MKRNIPKLRKGAWFVSVRGSYLPMTWQAWLLYIPYTVYIIAALLYVIGRSASILELVITLVPYWLSAVIIMTWIAKRKS